MLLSFAVGASFERTLGRSLPVGQRWLYLPGLHPMMRDHFGMLLFKRGELFADRLCYQPVQDFALTLEQRLVGSVADKCMLEQIGGIGGLPCA